MSDAAAIPLKQTQSIKAGQMMLAGKIDNNRKYSGKHYTRLVLAAADEYSAPSYVEIESDLKLGDIESTWRGVVYLRGYRNDYDSRDGDGEKIKVKSARNVLVAVE